MHNVGIHGNRYSHPVIDNKEVTMVPAQVLNGLADPDHLANVHLFSRKWITFGTT